MASKSRRRAEKRERRTPAALPHADPARRHAGQPTRRNPGPRPAKPPRALLGGRRLVVGLGVAAVAVAGLVIGLSMLSAQRAETAASPPAGVTGAAATRALLAGIPQHGNTLGSPAAPLRLVEYADPQCPFCAVYVRDVLPTLIREYVRPGRVQLEFRGLAFLGPGSVDALRTATAAEAESRMWNVLELLYRNQGPENAWVTDDLLRAITVASGADADRVAAARDDADVVAKLGTWVRLAQADGVTGVPAFFLGRTGGPLDRVPVRALAVPEFRAALDAALGR